MELFCCGLVEALQVSQFPEVCRVLMFFKVAQFGCLCCADVLLHAGLRRIRTVQFRGPASPGAHAVRFVLAPGQPTLRSSRKTAHVHCVFFTRPL